VDHLFSTPARRRPAVERRWCWLRSEARHAGGQVAVQGRVFGEERFEAEVEHSRAIAALRDLGRGAAREGFEGAGDPIGATQRRRALLYIAG
jgi:hypothetical protein